MRDDTHPDDAAPLGAYVDQAHRVRVQFCAESHPYGDGNSKKQNYSAPQPPTASWRTSRHPGLCTRCQPENADRPLTPDDLLDAMVWVLICNGIAADQITRAADAAEEEYYGEAGRRRRRNRTEYKLRGV